MLKGNSKAFFERVRMYFRMQLLNDNATKYFTTEEKAYKFKQDVIAHSGAFTPETVKQVKIYSGGAFFHGVAETIETLACFFAETEDEKQAYIKKHEAVYFKDENAERVYNFFANVLYNCVEKLAKNVEAVPEISFVDAFMADTFFLPSKSLYYSHTEHAHFITPDMFVYTERIDNCKSAPNVREFCRRNVRLIYKNNVLYDVIVRSDKE